MPELVTRVRALVTDARAHADAEHADAMAREPERASTRALVVLVVAALSLTFANYASASPPGDLGDHELQRLLWWAACWVVGYTVLPLLTIRYGLRERWRDYGLRLRSTASFARPYALLYVVAAPALFVASANASFQAKYPFYDLAPGEGVWPRLCIWWVAYALQFCALEFFFRGFLVHGLVPRFGYLAVAVMAVPYVMLHFGKPMPEALAALGGAFVLGTLAVRSRTVWYGAALHIAIAGTMDVLALWRK